MEHFVLGHEAIGQTPEGRNIIANPDGSYSTERTRTIRHPMINGGAWTNVPSIFGGRELATDDEIAEVLLNYQQQSGSPVVVDPETGRELAGFRSKGEALEAAKARSRELGIILKQLGYIR